MLAFCWRVSLDRYMFISRIADGTDVGLGEQQFSPPESSTRIAEAIDFW